MKWLLILVFCYSVSGDVIVLKNGGRIEGTIIKTTKETVIVKQGKMQIGVERSEIDSIQKKKYYSTIKPKKIQSSEMKKTPEGQVRFHLKGETASFDNKSYNFCKDSSTLHKKLSEYAKKGIGFLITIDASMSFMELYISMSIVGLHSENDFVVSYQGKKYRFKKVIPSRGSEKRLLHTIVYQENTLTEGCVNGFNASLEWNTKTKFTCNTFFNAVLQTKKKHDNLIDSDETILGFTRKEKVDIVFKVTEELLKKRMSENFLAIVRDNENKDYSSDCYASYVSNKSSYKGDHKEENKMRTGGRSRESIVDVIRNNLEDLKTVYNTRRIKKPSLKGQITVKFTINQYGNVVSAKSISSTMNDQEFISKIVKKIKTLKFKEIHKPGDITEIVYPFVFNP